MTTETDFRKIEDDELRERVLEALETLQRRLKGGDRGITTKSDPPNGSPGETVLALKALFDADGTDANAVTALKGIDADADAEPVGEDAEGWMNQRRTFETPADSEPDTERPADADAEGWI